MVCICCCWNLSSLAAPELSFGPSSSFWGEWFLQKEFWSWAEPILLFDRYPDSSQPFPSSRTSSDFGVNLRWPFIFPATRSATTVNFAPRTLSSSPSAIHFPSWERLFSSSNFRATSSWHLDIDEFTFLFCCGVRLYFCLRLYLDDKCTQCII